MNWRQICVSYQRLLLVIACGLFLLLSGCATKDFRKKDYFAQFSEVTFSLDGRDLAVGRTVFNSVYLFDAAGLQLKRSLPGNETADRETPAKVLAISLVGGRVAMIENDGSLVVRNIATGQVVFRSRSVEGITAATISPRGQYLVAAGSGTSATLWSISDAKELGVLSGHDGPIMSLSFSSDGLLIASGSEDRAVRIWNVATQEQVALLEGHQYPVHSVAFSSDGSTLAAYAGEVRLWDLADGKALTQLLSTVDTSALEGLAVIASLLGSARSVSLGGAPLGAPPIGAATVPTGTLNPIGRAVRERLFTRFSPDGKHLAFARLNPTWGGDFEVVLVNLRTHAVIVRIPCRTAHPCGDIAFSPDGKVIAVAMAREVRLVEVPSGKQIASYRGPFPTLDRAP